MIEFVENISIESISDMADDELVDIALRLGDINTNPKATEHTREVVDTINAELHNRTFYKVTGTFKSDTYEDSNGAE